MSQSKSPTTDFSHLQPRLARQNKPIRKLLKMRRRSRQESLRPHRKETRRRVNHRAENYACDQINEFYKKGCQEKTSASTGARLFSRDPAHSGLVSLKTFGFCYPFS